MHPNDRHRYEEILQRKYRYISTTNGDSSSTSLMDNIDVQCSTCCNGDTLLEQTNEQNNKDYYFDGSGTGTRMLSISQASQSFNTMPTVKPFTVNEFLNNNSSTNERLNQLGQSRYQTRFFFISILNLTLS